MSTKTYVICASAALLIDEEIAAYYRLSKDRQDGTVPPEIQALSPEEFRTMAREGTLPCGYDNVDLTEMADDIEMAVLPDFEGDVESVFPDKTCDPLDEQYDNAYIGYVTAENDPDFFKAVYGSPEDILDEFKRKLRDIGLPADFDWWKRIVRITGTIVE